MEIIVYCETALRVYYKKSSIIIFIDFTLNYHTSLRILYKTY